jgi:hypothetical protein
VVEIVAHKKDDVDSPPPKKVLKYTITLEDRGLGSRATCRRRFP